MRCRNASERYVVSLAIAVGAGVPGVAARADTPEDMQAQMKLLQAKVGDLEQQQQASERKQDATAASVVTAGATRGSFRLPGSNTSVAVGGYVKLDAVFSNPSAGINSTADLFLQPNAIPVKPGAGDNEHDQVKFGARESRLFVKTSTPTAGGDLTTYVEGDFYGADANESVSNSSGPRLRHAFGSLGPLLGGQTWTNFMYVPSLPETLDPDGRLALPRQWGWYAGYRHFWRQDLRSNLVLSGATETNPAGAPGSTNRSTHSLHANLIGSPIANTDLGVEYIHADRETEDGLNGRLNRFQASAKSVF